MSTNESSRLAHVDTLRLMAAGLVVFQHLAERHTGPLVKPLVALGPGVMGVVLFFLISGYVIPFSVRRGLDLRGFMIRRLCRIYPLFLAALAIVAATGWSGLLANFSDLRAASPLQCIANLLLVQDFFGVPAILDVSWTLIIELIWYGLFAVTLLLFREKAATLLAIAVPLGLVALGLLSLALDTRIPLARPAMIYAAVLGYQAYCYRSGLLSSRQMGVAVAMFVAVTWLTNFIAFGVFAHPHITLAQAVGPWSVAPALFLLVVLVPGIRDARVLDSGMLPTIGAVSYSIYLLHPIANAAADQYVPDSLMVPVALGLTFVLALAGYHWIERPGIALGRRLAAPRPRLTMARS